MVSALALAITISLLPGYAVTLPNSGAVGGLNQAAGVTRRYAVQSQNGSEELLAMANEHGWDVWQVSHSHVDVHFPPSSYPLDLPHFPHLDFAPPPSSGSSATTGAQRKDWKTPPRGDTNGWSLNNSSFHGDYHSLDEIHAFIRDLAAEYPQKLTVVPLGHTGEGREMIALQISDNSLPNYRSHDHKQAPFTQHIMERPGFLIAGAQHAREWVATAAALYLAHALVANSSELYSLSHLLERHNFYIIPVPNPDGHVYTWETDRFWYKNRLPLGPTARCIGVDMNRNWGYKWKAHPKYLQPEYIAPEDPCSHWYPGHRPFQAPEVNSMANYIEQLPQLSAFLDLRSYGQMLSAPYSYSCKRSPKDAEDQLEAISGAAHAVKKTHGTAFTTGTLCSTLYRAPGNIVDWMYARMGVKYSFAAHLRDTGTYGFALPPQWIRPVGEETTKMVEYIANFITLKGK
ncbi:hypothetical protein FA95DRAFT_1610896 [Auriscalpium vulgare]|uniref:Uncharacterized protein n=1 Tax=Auriscalpium vulgare TaxID=40419 RepID=A0ACB8RD85_9AGAM|nr:hypothetical protein FA95DRAFT_1610896 [Auriscalpium vulgare]